MAAITSTVGLSSGLNIEQIVTALVTNQQSILTRLDARQKTFQSQQVAFTSLSAKLLTLKLSGSTLGTKENFAKFKATSSNADQVTASVTGTAAAGSYQLQTVRLASAQQALSRGFTSDQDLVGEGTITIARGGSVTSDVALEALNGGSGVRRGTIRITDRSGASSDIDLSGASTVKDVVATINAASGINVTASIEGDRLALTDNTGASVSNLIVAERNGGRTAEDLGLKQSVAGASLSGQSIYQLSGNFALSGLNDGLTSQLASGTSQADLKIQLSDVAETALEVDLNGATKLADVVNRINNHTSNAGKVTASITNNRLVLTDNTGGGGAQAFAVTNLNGSTAATALGLDETAVGNTLSGRRLLAGLGSVLLGNLNGGAGITQTGQIQLTDRAGLSATLNLTGAESLDQVIAAINTAESSGTRLAITASLNAAGNGLTITDSSGASASNLIIADIGGSTLAADLKIGVNAAQTSVESGSLALRTVGEGTSLSKYAPGDSAVRLGSIGIADSTGFEYFVNLSGDDVKTVGDVISKINAATSGKVVAQLNSTGDGFQLIDEAAGAGQVVVRELGGNTAKDLRLLGTGTTGLDGKSRLGSRLATVISTTATDTLATLRDKLNEANAGLGASLVDDGSGFSSQRLLINSSKTGTAGQFVFDDGGLDLGLTEHTAAKNALLRVSGGGGAGLLASSSTNSFANVISGLSVTAVSTGSSPATITVAQDSAKISDAINSFVKAYNDLQSTTASLTKFDTNASLRGALSGDGTVQRLLGNLSGLVTGNRLGTQSGEFTSLQSIGITIGATGQLSVDSTALTASLSTDAAGVGELFLTAETGFAAKLQNIVEAYTDDQGGKLTAASGAIDASLADIERQITLTNTRLDARKERLFTQFFNMESLLSRLNSQQQALASFTSILSTSTSSK